MAHITESFYSELIRKDLDRMGAVADPRHIEGYMRIVHSTLDGLSASEFRSEVALCFACVQEGGTEAAESNAQSFGL